MNSSQDDRFKNILNYENHQVTYFMIDDEIWFKGKDITEILKYSDSDQALRKNVEVDDKIKFRAIVDQTRLLDGIKNLHPNTIFINESGLYSLIIGSKKEEAKKFKRWITKEVLPSIRKYGTHLKSTAFCYVF